LHKAIELYEQALQINREIGDRRGEGITLGNIGQAFFALGEGRKAIDFYNEHLKFAREVGDRRGEGNALGNIGQALAASGDLHRAIDFYNEHLKLAREVGDRRGEGNALAGLGDVNYFLGEYRKSVELYQQSLSIVREIDNRRTELKILNNLGRVSVLLNELPKAIEYGKRSLDVLDSLSTHPQGLVIDSRSLRVFLCHSTRDKAFARELYTKLINFGIDVWFDEKTLLPGQDWELEIERAIQYSDVILVCMSTQSVKSEGFIYKEIKYALDRADKMPEGEIFIIPCRFDEASLPFRLRPFQRADLFKDDGLDKLTQSLGLRASKLGLELKRK